MHLILFLLFAGFCLAGAFNLLLQTHPINSALSLIVVMLLNAGREERTLGSRAARTVGFPAVVAILAVLASVLLRAQGLGVAGLADNITPTEELSRVLFHELLLPFEVTSVLILIAILGAVAIASPGRGYTGVEGERVDHK